MLAQPLVVDRYFPFDIIARDGALTREYIEDKLERKSSASLLRTLLTQMEDLQPNIVQRNFLGADVNVQRLVNKDEGRVLIREGLWVIVNKSTQVIRRVLPVNFDVGAYAISNHIIDRCSVGCGLAFFMMHVGALWSFRFGIFRDKWNSVKNSLGRAI